MASRRGATDQRTDGNHHSRRNIIRGFINRLVQEIRVNAENKASLKLSILGHYVLLVVMAFKLLPELLEKLDISVLRMGEPFVPKARLWEWIWMTSVLPTIIAWSACRRAKILPMKIFVMCIYCTGLVPVLVGLWYNFEIFYYIVIGCGDRRISNEFRARLGVPIEALWHLFFFIAIQIHIRQLYLGYTLVKAWKPQIPTGGRL